MKSHASAKKDWWKPASLMAVVLALLMAARMFHLGDQVGALQDWIKSLGVWGPLVYGLIYVVAVVAVIPGSAVTLLAGGLFGTVLGTVVVSLGSTVGAALCFLIARYFAREAVEKWVQKNEKFKKLDQMTAQQGAVIVAITRLIPLFPFNLLNYGFGLTKVSFWQYTLWSWICMMPGTILYVLAGDAAAKGLSQGRVPWNLIFVGMGVFLLLWLLGRGLRGKLAAK